MSARSLIRTGLVGLSLVTGVAIAPQMAGASGLTMSATSGAARSRISVSAASCVGDAVAWRTLDVRLLVGPAPSQKLAGAGTNGGVGNATLIVPDWPNPNEPAAVEATCTSVDQHTLASTTVAYGPVPFDVLPSSNPTTLDASFSRTTFKVGQAAFASGSGCTEAGTLGALSGAHGGSDVSGRSYADPMWGPWGGFHGVDPLGHISGTITAESSAVIIEVFNWQDPPHAQITVSEAASAVRPGPHVAFTTCQHQDGTQLFTKPKGLTLTPNPAVEQSDMVAVPSPPTLPHRVRLSGHGCTQGTVSIEASGASLADIRASLRVGAGGSGGTHRPGRTPIEVRRSGERAPAPLGRTTRTAASSFAASVTSLSSTTVTPDSVGNWSYELNVPFTDGFVGGQAVCGNPMGTGFRYHAQAVRLGGGSGPGGGSGAPD